MIDGGDKFGSGVHPCTHLYSLPTIKAICITRADAQVDRKDFRRKTGMKSVQQLKSALLAGVSLWYRCNTPVIYYFVVQVFYHTGMSSI